eukprot:2143351-Pleurochrysis_carterae.AAC.2
MQPFAGSVHFTFSLSLSLACSSACPYHPPSTFPHTPLLPSDWLRLPFIPLLPSCVPPPPSLPLPLALRSSHPP